MTDIINGPLRMLGDRILLKPLEWDASKILIAIRHGRAVRGEVVSVGPGCHPKKYKAGPKGPRSLMDYSKRFQRTELKPGDVVELGGLNIFDGKGYIFPEVMIGTVRHIIVQEADVAIVRDDLKLSQDHVPDESDDQSHRNMDQPKEQPHRRMHSGSVSKVINSHGPEHTNGRA